MMTQLSKTLAGYAGIKKDGVWGSIDLLGNISCEPTYNLVYRLKAKGGKKYWNLK